MRKLKKKVVILIFALCVSVLLSSCKFMMPLDKREEVMTEIAAIVNDNYSSDEVETPYDIRMTEIYELADKNSYLHKAIEKYDDVQHYHVYLVETIVVPGLGYDNSQIGIIDRLGKSNVYSFSAGL